MAMPLLSARQYAGLSVPHNLSLDAVLITQFAHKIAEQEARGWILSSVNEDELTGEARYCMIIIFEKWAQALDEKSMRFKVNDKTRGGQFMKLPPMWSQGPQAQC